MIVVVIIIFFYNGKHLFQPKDKYRDAKPPQRVVVTTANKDQLRTEEH